MTIGNVSSIRQLKGILSSCKDSDKLTVIDFHATWCSPCNAIAPVFETLSREYKQVTFLKCDVDAAKDVARRYSISAMPTFVFFKGGKKVDQVKGSDKNGLQDTIRKYAASTTTASGDVVSLTNNVDEQRRSPLTQIASVSGDTERPAKTRSRWWSMLMTRVMSTVKWKRFAMGECTAEPISNF